MGRRPGPHATPEAAPERVVPDADTVFAALAEPIRRQLIDQLSTRGPSTATELAPDYPVTRQAIVRHLSALTDAGLLETTKSGRDVRYGVVAEPFDDAVAWLTEVGGRWDTRLVALRRRLEEN